MNEKDLSQDINSQWHQALTLMLADYREMNPEDKRNDRELLASLMDYLHQSGIIRKERGKYLLPRIDDFDELRKLIKSRKN